MKKGLDHWLWLIEKKVRAHGIEVVVLWFSLLVLTSCRTSRPPAMPVFIHEGGADPAQGVLGGGADGVERDGTPAHRNAEDLKQWWMTDADGIARFTEWCYDLRPGSIEAHEMPLLQEKILKENKSPARAFQEILELRRKDALQRK